MRIKEDLTLGPVLLLPVTFLIGTFYLLGVAMKQRLYLESVYDVNPEAIFLRTHGVWMILTIMFAFAVAFFLEAKAPVESKSFFIVCCVSLIMGSCFLRAAGTCYLRKDYDTPTNAQQSMSASQTTPTRKLKERFEKLEER